MNRHRPIRRSRALAAGLAVAGLPLIAFVVSAPSAEQPPDDRVHSDRSDVAEAAAVAPEQEPAPPPARMRDGESLHDDALRAGADAESVAGEAPSVDTDSRAPTRQADDAELADDAERADDPDLQDVGERAAELGKQARNLAPSRREVSRLAEAAEALADEALSLARTATTAADGEPEADDDSRNPAVRVVGPDESLSIDVGSSTVSIVPGSASSS